MESKHQFNDFVNEVEPAYRAFVTQTHDYLTENGCRMEIKTAKNGYLVSYQAIPSKRVVVNFVFRKQGLIIRIYGDRFSQYLDLLETLPESMVKSIEKAPVCKRLIDPSSCNSRCPMGYDFTIHGARYQKCKYSCFMFAVTPESLPYITAFLKKEIDIRQRSA